MGTYIQAAKQGEIAENAGKAIDVQGKSVALIRSNGSYYAVDNECTHVGGPLCEGMISGVEVTCPWHAAKFDLRTGEVKAGPARHPVRTYPVRVQGEDIEIEV